MKKKQNHTLVVIALAFYVFSLFPFLAPVKNDTIALESVIQQIQKLHSASISEQTDFPTALRGSLTALRIVAGINTVIVKKAGDSETTTDYQLVTLVVKLPHLLPANTYDNSIAIGPKITPITTKQIYTSPHFPPETPPPVTTSC